MDTMDIGCDFKNLKIHRSANFLRMKMTKNPEIRSVDCYAYRTMTLENVPEDVNTFERKYIGSFPPHLLDMAKKSLNVAVLAHKRRSKLNKDKSKKNAHLEKYSLE